MSTPGKYSDNVFINCPFDPEYKPLFEAIVFAVIDCGFTARCALEVDNGLQNRLDKILRIIGQCQYSVHDISRTELDAENQLPRFNMPFELGLYLGARRFGPKKHKKKEALILDHTPYRFQKFLSDIAGADIMAHNNKPEEIIVRVRDWLRTTSRRKTLPGGNFINRRYDEFRLELPELCQRLNLAVEDLTYNDFVFIAQEWLHVRDTLVKNTRKIGSEAPDTGLTYGHTPERTVSPEETEDKPGH